MHGVQPDPIGYADGMNMYAYVGNDPINNIDPLGLDTIVVTGTRGSCSPGAACISGSADIRDFLNSLNQFRESYFGPGGGFAASAGESNRTRDGEGDRLEPWDGRDCQTISSSNRQAYFWSQSDVSYTLEIYWSSAAPLPGGKRVGRAVAPSIPGVDVSIFLSDPSVVGRNRDYGMFVPITPASTENNPFTLTLPNGGDLYVNFNRRETTPGDAEITVCATANANTS